MLFGRRLNALSRWLQKQKLFSSYKVFKCIKRWSAVVVLRSAIVKHKVRGGIFRIQGYSTTVSGVSRAKQLGLRVFFRG